ncbi:MAG: DUF4251 domain-containing protein [Sphingobacteriales bacterium]|nr:DUF4251 domain-containing protein [Sphingobacteriales bacterium]
MKKYFSYLLVPALLLLVQSGCAPGPKLTATKEELVQAIAADKWTFAADQADPQYGRNRSLDAGYEVKCSKEKLVVYLPYFGRAYSGAGVYSNQRPLDFTSRDFNLSKEKDNKGRWLVTIRPKDAADIAALRFTFFENGTASLDAELSSRSPVSFRGYVRVLQ